MLYYLNPLGTLSKFIFFLLLGCTTNSCIPLQIAPNIEGGKIYRGKKFQKQLPKQEVYVFEDPKNANEFYTYINAKFDIDYDVDGGNVPIIINDQKYYFTFYEVERKTKTVNLIPIAVDTALDSKDIDPVFENSYISRSGSWYIALTVTDDNFNDNLKIADPAYKEIIKYLDHLRSEYLNTANYMEIHLKSK